MMGKAEEKTRGGELRAFDPETDAVNVIIDTPKWSRNKFKFDEEQKIFKLAGVLPAGAVFPFDFGYVPSTRGGDGDPLDVLVLMDEPAFVGCLVATRLLGVIEAEQTEEGNTVRNDRLIGVAVVSRNHRTFETLDDVTPNLLDEIEHFFESYNAAKGKVFTPLGRSGPEAARRLITDSQKPARRPTSRSRRQGSSKEKAARGKRRGAAR